MIRRRLGLERPRDRGGPGVRRPLRGEVVAALAIAGPAIVALGGPAGAAASQWSPTRTATTAGNSFEPVATVGGGNRLAIAWVRQLGGQRVRPLDGGRRRA